MYREGEGSGAFLVFNFLGDDRTDNESEHNSIHLIPGIVLISVAVDRPKILDVPDKHC